MTLVNTKGRRKIEHLNRVLGAMISIHQLIAREKTQSRLLQGICELFVSSRGYHNAWVGLLDPAGKLRLVAQSGLGDLLPFVVGKLEAGHVPNCMKLALSDKNPVLCVSGSPLCQGCSMSGTSLGHGTISTSLRHGSVKYGLLNVSMHKDLQADADEQTLVRELASDIAYALHKIDLEKESQASLKALKDSEEFNSALLDNAPNPIIVINADTSIRYVNPAFEKLTGFRYSEICGKKAPHPWWSKGQKGKMEQDLKRGLSEGLRKVEELFQRKNGEQFWVELTLVQVHQHPRSRYYLSNWVDITERKRFEESLQFYVKQVITAHENERRRIARELHDETAQSIAALYNDIDNIFTAHKDLPKEVIEILSQLELKLDAILEEVRRFSHELRPGLLDQFGLVPSLEHLVEEFGRDGSSCAINVFGDVCRLSPETEVVLFRVVQEALNNVKKHAQAKQAKITVRFGRKNLTLRIDDNGRGFEVPFVIGSLSRKGKLGLIGIEERVRLLNGKLRVRSVPGEGTTVFVTLPATSLVRKPEIELDSTGEPDDPGKPVPGHARPVTLSER